MKTKVSDSFFLRGDEITEKPQEGIKCHHCDKDIGQDDKHIKIASLIVNKDDELIIHWDWFCNRCLKMFVKQLKKDDKKTCN